MWEELLALWSILWVAYNFEVANLHIYGDAKTMIDGITSHFTFQLPVLLPWFRRIQYLRGRLLDPPIQHIFHEANTKAYTLSKHGLLLHFRSVHVQHYRGAQLVSSNLHPLP